MELTLVISILGVIMTVLSAGIVALLRSEPIVSRSIGESHDQQQLLNYLYEDVRATDSIDVNTNYELLGYTRAAAAPGCGPAGSSGPNVLQLTWRDDAGLQRSSYRLIEGAEGALLQRDHCAIAGVVDTWPSPPPDGIATGITNIADRLDHIPADWDNSDAPAHVTVDGDVLTMVLTQAGRELHASATLRGDLGLLPTPPTTPPPPTTPVATTTTVPEPPTTTTTAAPTTTVAPSTTAPPTLLTSVCDLLVMLTGAVDITPATGLLRDMGAGAVSSPLARPVRITAGVRLDLDLPGGLVSLSLCANLQLSYNTGLQQVTVPLSKTESCAERDPVLGIACVALQLTLTVELPATAAQPWESGFHQFAIVDSGGAALSSTIRTLEVKPDLTTVPATTTTATTTTTTAPPPVTVPTVGQGQPLNPLAAAQGFSVMVEGDAALRGVTVQGGVAAGGNVGFSSAGIASAAAATVSAPGEPSALGLMVGGALDLSAASASAMAVANGFVHAGSLPGGKVLTSGAQTHIVPAGATGTNGTPRVSVTGADQTDQARYPVVRPLVFPFANTFAALNRSSTGAAALTPTNCPAGHPTSPPQPALEFPEVYKQSGNWVLNLVAGSPTAPAVNVLNLTSKQLAAMVGVTGTVVPDASTTLVINITDHGNVSMSAPTWTQLTGARAQSVLWNFPNANRVAISGSLPGSVLAPAALVTLSGAIVNGDVVAESLMTSGTSTVNVAHFDQLVPCIG